MILLELLLLPLSVVAFIFINYHLISWLRRNVGQWWCFWRQWADRQTISLEINACLLLIFWHVCSWVFWYWVLHEKSSLYLIAFWVFVAGIVTLVALIQTLFAFKAKASENILSAWPIIKYIVPVAVIYWATLAGQSFIAELFQFNSSNVHMATSLATSIYIGYSIGFLLILSSFPLELYLFSVVMGSHKSLFRKVFWGVMVSAAFIFSLHLIATLITGLPNYPYTKILIGRIAFDIDSMPPTTCLTRKEIAAHEQRGYFSVVVIPLSTSAAEGYIMLAPAHMPSDKSILDYKKQDVIKFLPRVIGYVNCSGDKFIKPSYE